MVKRKSTTRVHSSRNLEDTAPTRSAAGFPKPLDGPIEAVITAIDDERARLMSAEAILLCLEFAVKKGPGQLTSVHYQSIVEVARNLIRDSIDQLDAVRMKPLLENIGIHGSFAVKQSCLTYVH